MANSTNYIITALATPVKDLVGKLTTTQRIKFLKSLQKSSSEFRTKRAQHETNSNGQLVITRMFIVAETDECLFEQIKNIVQTYKFLKYINCQLTENTHEGMRARIFNISCTSEYSDSGENVILIQIGAYQFTRQPTDEHCGMLFRPGEIIPLTQTYDLVPQSKLIEMYSTFKNDEGELIGVFEPPKSQAQVKLVKKAIKKCNKL